MYLIKVYNQSLQLVAFLENAFAIGYETPLNSLWRASFSLPAKGLRTLIVTISRINATRHILRYYVFGFRRKQYGSIKYNYPIRAYLSGHMKLERGQEEVFLSHLGRAVSQQPKEAAVLQTRTDLKVE